MVKTRQSKRRDKDGINIFFDIKCDSTCVSLNLPVLICCDICKPKNRQCVECQKRAVSVKNNFAITHETDGDVSIFG